MVQWLTEVGVTHVAMEGTGIYWRLGAQPRPVAEHRRGALVVAAVVAASQRIRPVPAAFSNTFGRHFLPAAGPGGT